MTIRQQLLKDIAELTQENARLRWIVGQFKPIGTDECGTCDTGRVTIFAANTRCMRCDSTGYVNPFDKVVNKLKSEGGAG